MKRMLNFEKDPDGLWYVILHEWEGERAELQMVAGADTMCNILAQGKNFLHTIVGDEPFEHADPIHFVYEGEEEGGAYYFVINLHGLSFGFQIWLCDVTKFIFGGFPRTIYLRSF